MRARWDIPRPVWTILLSWGLAVLLISALLSAWIWTNQRSASEQRDEFQREQDRTMCAVLDLLTSGPAPVAGPAGDRARRMLAAVKAHQSALRCAAPARPG